VRPPKDGQFQLVLARPLPVVVCNRGWCREIFVHLISNALRFTDTLQKRVEIGTIDATDAHTRPGCPPGSEKSRIYYVTDYGIGIKPSYFSRFSRDCMVATSTAAALAPV
jgi:signal transduction histidine kinase